MNLNELVANDNSRGRRDAQISQFPLPADGTYYLLARRADLANGTTTGDYTLRLTVGTVALTPGSVTARLRWNTDDDLNLFIREPSGRVISWSNPDPPDSGQLQIDSNTNCTTRSAQPVEYIYWPPADLPENGDYEVWVWYQQACGQDNPVTFSFDLAANDDTVLEHQSVTLEPGERFNIDIRVSQPDVFVLQPGTVTRPTPQQRASEGGDIPLLMGETVTGSISNDVYARFYQFQGQAGEEITLEARAVTGDLDPVLVLRDNTESNLAQADDISRGQPQRPPHAHAALYRALRRGGDALRRARRANRRRLPAIAAPGGRRPNTPKRHNAHGWRCNETPPTAICGGFAPTPPRGICIPRPCVFISSTFAKSGGVWGGPPTASTCDYYPAPVHKKAVKTPSQRTTAHGTAPYSQ